MMLRSLSLLFVATSEIANYINTKEFFFFVKGDIDGRR